MTFSGTFQAFQTHCVLWRLVDLLAVGYSCFAASVSLVSMSMDEGAPAPAPAPPAPAGGNDDMNFDDIDDPELRMALQMSMQDVP